MKKSFRLRWGPAFRSARPPPRRPPPSCPGDPHGIIAS
ncbi:hypothetical protein T12_4204 [Trichinella patagoniensis]|uniref:Uncharacterized protein n=1 Tax=Trichinella patagoniensis TaxID=990121 RepID=A0A0V0W3L2_9BILA|nr:hypothetical protein T12_4204 [Trichinella patagoniensis]